MLLLRAMMSLFLSGSPKRLSSTTEVRDRRRYESYLHERGRGGRRYCNFIHQK